LSILIAYMHFKFFPCLCAKGLLSNRTFAGVQLHDSHQTVLFVGVQLDNY